MSAVHAASVTIVDNEFDLGLVAHLPMDESGGSTAYDISGNDNDATITGADFVLGKIGNALDFNGLGDYAVISNNSSIALSDSVTISFWVNGSAQPGYNRLVSYRDINGGDGIEVNVSGGTADIALRIDTSGGVNQTFVISDVLDGTWHHLTYTLDSGNVYGYLDGEQVIGISTRYNHGGGFGNSNDWVIGADSDYADPEYNLEFDGLIDDFRLYSTALTGSDIRAVDLNLVAHLRMDESGGSTVYDISGNDNDATVTGADFVGGKSGNALDFDGLGDYAVISNSTSTVLNDDATIAFWVNGSAQPDYHRLVSNRTQTGGDGLEIFVHGGTDDVTLRIDTSGGAGQTLTVPDVLDGTWHHLAFALNNGAMAAYLDGELVTGVSTSYDHGDGFGNSNDWVIGADSDYNQGFDGLIDDFRLYSNALSEADINALEFQLRGDFNRDSVFNSLDITGFKLALADTVSWELSTGLNAATLGDFNGDNVMNSLDITGFKAGLSGSAVVVATGLAEESVEPLSSSVSDLSSDPIGVDSRHALWTLLARRRPESTQWLTHRASRASNGYRAFVEALENSDDQAEPILAYSLATDTE